METRDIITNVLSKIIHSVPSSSLGDTVTIQIKRASDSYYWNFTSLVWGATEQTGTMTFDNNEFWYAEFTPNTNDDYHMVTITRNSIKYTQVLHSLWTSIPAEYSGGGLTSTANVKEFFNITGTGLDTLIGKLITRITKEIQNICDRKLISETFTEYYSGSNSSTLMVNQYPITAIDSIYDDIDRVFGVNTLIPADDYIFNAGSLTAEAGIIKLEGFAFCHWVNNIKITYTAGYTTIPGDLEEACILMVGADKLFHDLIFNIPMIEGEFSEQKDPGGMRKRAKDILQLYKRVR